MRLPIRALLLSLLVLPAFAVGAAPSAAAPINDDYEDRLPIQLGFGDSRSNAGATIEANEALTENDPSGLGCDLQGNPSADGVNVYGTLWWGFTGNGGTVTVSTLHSNFDTVLAVYEVEGKELVKCSDDIQPLDPTREELEARLTSEVRIDTVAGRAYAVQVGGCAPPERCYKTTSGSVTLRVSPTPGNDDRASATPIGAGAPVTVTNTGATEEPGETLACGNDHLYGKTVWFRYTAPAVGTAAFSTAGFDTVLAVYHGNSITPLGCNDDAVDGQTGGSRIPTIQPPGPLVEVTPGDYLIQVGGYYDSGFDIVAARNGPFDVQVEFNPDLDLDDDGVTNELDCSDSDPAIHPGAKEIRGNKVDENCDGRAPDLPVIGTKFLLASKQYRRDPHTRVSAFIFKHVPAGARVEIRCRGRGCPYRERRHKVGQKRGNLVLPAGFRVEVGTRLILLATKRGMIGREEVFLIRRTKRPASTPHCLDSRGHRRPCPSAER